MLAIALKEFYKYYDLNIKINILKHFLCLIILSFGFTVSIQNYYSYGFRNFMTILKHDNPYSRKIVGFLSSEISKDKDLYFLASSRFLNNRFPENCIFPQIDIVSCCTFPRKTFNYSNFEEEVINGNIKFYITEGEIVDLFNVELRNKFSENALKTIENGFTEGVITRLL